jgi:hypothetical protein
MDNINFFEKVIEREQLLANKSRAHNASCTQKSSSSSFRQQLQQGQLDLKREESLNRAKKSLASLYLSDRYVVLSKSSKKKSIFNDIIDNMTEQERYYVGEDISDQYEAMALPPPLSSSKKKKTYKLLSNTLSSPGFSPAMTGEVISDTCLEDNDVTAANQSIVKDASSTLKLNNKRCSNIKSVRCNTSLNLVRKEDSSDKKKDLSKWNQQVELLKHELFPMGTQPVQEVVPYDMINRRLQNCLRRLVSKFKWTDLS